VDSAELYRRSRPAGAADPEREPTPDERWSAPPAPTTPETIAPPEGGITPLLQRASDAEQKGNSVRAAILRTQAAAATHGLDRERAAEAALGSVAQLVNRLGDLLDWDADTREEWRQALRPMLPPAARGIWPRAARCLYELQRIPADCAREVYAVDLPEYIRTFGRRPMRRHLPHARPVMMLMAFRKAHQQLLRSGLPEPEQLRLDRLIHHEIHRGEHSIRHTLTPIIVAELTAAGLTPTNRVEEVARDKLVAELLDRVCERGYLRIGDLRDAIARNQLKLDNLSGPGEFIGGDALLRADNRLAYALDGVYRRGEFYLRWIQRFASVFFGTPWGRALTLFVALPFGGAFLTLMAAEHVQHMGEKAIALASRSFDKPPERKSTAPVAPVKPPGAIAPVPVPVAATAPAHEQPVGDWQFDEETLEFYLDDPEPPPVPTARDRAAKELEDRLDLAVEIFTSTESSKKQEHAHAPSVLTAWPTVVGFGVFLLLVFHVPPFRRAVFAVFGHLWWAVRLLVWDLPSALWHSRAFRAVRLSGTVRFLRRKVATPLMLSLIALGLLLIVGVSLRLLAWYGWILFVLLLVSYNTSIGWKFQDHLAEIISDWWRQVRVNLLIGFIAWLIDVFQMLANWVERQLYAVDEWMRFRGGDSQGSLAMKAVLGLVWFPIAYVTRFVFYLLAEPQINPVKHFPVVTVSHKVLAPILLGLVPTLAEVVGQETAGTIYFFTQLLLPGVFGFLAWELKENWRLYAENRSPKLRPDMVGSHGETVRGLLRPGFHSGTVPKILRQSRHAIEAGDRAKVAFLHHDLEHTATGVHRFAERELIPLLVGSPEWGGVAVEVGPVRFGVQRAEVELSAPALGRDPFVLALENVGGQIEGSVSRVGWADKLTDAQRSTVVFALRGLLDMAAAARFDGRDRTFDAPEEPGFGALVRMVTWDEWKMRWGATSAERGVRNAE
jgi:hypothetical protein